MMVIVIVQRDHITAEGKGDAKRTQQEKAVVVAMFIGQAHCHIESL